MSPHPLVLVLVAVLGWGVGSSLERLHDRGWYSRPGDPPPGHVPPLSITSATALSWVAVLHVLGSGPPTRPTSVSVLLVLVHLTVVTVGILLAAADVAQRRLPDIATLPTAMFTVLAFWLVTALADGADDLAALRALVAAVAVPAGLFAFTLLIGGLGLGDVKLSCPIAAVLAWHGATSLVWGLMLAWALAAAWGCRSLLRGASRATPIPLAPFLTAGTMLALVHAA